MWRPVSVWPSILTTATTPTSCCSGPTSPCTQPRTPTPSSWCSTSSSTSTARGGWPCSELRRAIEDEQLAVHYQPIVDAHTSKVLGVEALVYWQHPERGLLPPGDFIPLAERTGLVAPLTRHVLDIALHQCRQWC